MLRNNVFSVGDISTNCTSHAHFETYRFLATLYILDVILGIPIVRMFTAEYT